MSDFLTRLAERTMGLVPVAKPVISPMFTPGVPGTDQSVSGFSGEIIVNMDNVHNAQYRKNLAKYPESYPVEPGVSQSEILNPASEPVDNMPVLRSFEAKISGNGNRKKIELEKQSPHEKEEFREQLDKLSSIQRHTLIAPYDQKGTINSQHNKLELRNAQSSFMEKSELSPKLLRNQPSQDSASPIIHVSIGRIEVRAATPQQPPMQKNKPVVTTLSLDDYLKKHNGGR